MSKKVLIMLSITFIFLVCLVLGRHYSIVQTSNINIKGHNLVFNCMSNNYKVIKKETDEKYILKINDAISKSKEEYSEKVNQLLGEEYSKLLAEISNGKKYIKTERELFYKTQEYLNAKAKLDECKVAYEKDDSEENKKNFHTALTDLATLNTTINNRLKSKREEIESAKRKLFSLFDDNKEKLIEIRKEVKENLKIQVLEIFKEYKFVIDELNKTYSQNEEIDVGVFTNKITDESVFSSFENDYFNCLEDKQKVVFSKPITNIN